MATPVKETIGGISVYVPTGDLARSGSRLATRLDSVRGKRIGITRFNASTHFAGLSMLDSAGIKPNEVVFI